MNQQKCAGQSNSIALGAVAIVIFAAGLKTGHSFRESGETTRARIQTT